MPRIYNSASEPLDFCKQCFPDETDALEEYGNVGDGPDDRGNCFDHNAAHPDYDGCDYTCEICNAPLTKRDN